MFTDEARFGRMNRIRPCWAPVKVRPEVAAQLIREYIYLYGAVSPEDGLPEFGAHRIHGFEHIVLEDFFADFIPEVFFRIEFR